ncbi:hypothetical protein Cgig2_022178 [Carnegiea gigantea]|uniref:Uncharacterized protein n=1 Tax=Carnegiea gigantea TaxID=171969 RepID=A0A9Q1GKH3_9CARY|nr:hypothetical protein Cgig2_022178 [Carnegiea gigantea]
MTEFQNASDSEADVYVTGSTMGPSFYWIINLSDKLLADDDSVACMNILQSLSELLIHPNIPLTSLIFWPSVIIFLAPLTSSLHPHFSLTDERFREERNTIYISKWLRKSIRTYDNFEMSVEELRSFFSNVKVVVGASFIDRVDSAKMLQDSVPDLENIPPDCSAQVSVKRKNQKLGKPHVGEKRIVLDNMISTMPSNCLSFQDDGVSGDMKLSNQEFLDSSPTYLSNMEIKQGMVDINCYSKEILRQLSFYFNMLCVTRFVGYWRSLPLKRPNV